MAEPQLSFAIGIRSLRRPFWILGIVVALAVLVTAPSSAREEKYAPFITTGSVVKNHDGDTIHLNTSDHGVLTIRLSGADTPETGQSHWKAARDRLRERVASQAVTAECYKKDRHGRDVCHVFVGESDLGLEMIQSGYAWFASAFAKELNDRQQASYPAAESIARQERRGLWSEPDPMPPWECRRLRKLGDKCR